VCVGDTINFTASVAPYSLETCTSSFIDISATGTAVTGALADDSEHDITLPFSFTFNGNTYTNARVGNNGAIALGASLTGDIGFTNGTLPTTANTAGNILLLPFWDDLDIQGGATL